MAKQSQWRYRMVSKFISKKPVAWLLSHIAHHVDQALMALTNGRWTAAALLTTLPVVALTTTGAKSGRPRTVPLLAIPDGDNLILIASNWGRGHHPGWYYNIRANPDVQVEAGGRTQAYTARETAGAERRWCWQLAVQWYPGYEAYQKWTKGREIPVILLVPRTVK